MTHVVYLDQDVPVILVYSRREIHVYRAPAHNLCIFFVNFPLISQRITIFVGKTGPISTVYMVCVSFLIDWNTRRGDKIIDNIPEKIKILLN